MGKFSDYVSSINEQTNILRENLTNATGVDCSKKSIGMCADVVADYVSDLEKEEVYYDRPSWYPDIKTILNSAPEITKDGKTYFPAYVMLFNNLYQESVFYWTYSTTVGAVNFYKNTDGDAVLCSDKCNNDISNANADALEVGKTITHTWDTGKDIADPSGNDKIKVRWAIIYVESGNSSRPLSPYFSGYNDCIEIIAGKVRLGAFANGYAGLVNRSIKYIEIHPEAYFTSAASTQYTYYYALLELIINCGSTAPFGSSVGDSWCLRHLKLPVSNITASFNNSLHSVRKLEIQEGTTCSTNATIFNTASSLKKITIPKGFTCSTMLTEAYSLEEIVFEGDEVLASSSSGMLSKAYNLKRVIFSENTKVLNLTYFANTHTYSLKYLKIPSSVTSLQTGQSTAPYVTYVELFNDFNISAVNFTGRSTKDLQWLRDLCVWLKDRTGDTANTMIIGSANLENARNLWLTFNPDNKRDITWVDAGTEGAINIVEFITTQLNWTLS